MNTESFKLSCIMSGSGLSGSYSLKDAKNKDFVHRTKFQSERTETVIEELMHKGTSSLPDYQTSSMQHLLLYPLFDKYFSENGFDIKHGIPIT